MRVETPEVAYAKWSGYGLRLLPEAELLPLVPAPKAWEYGKGVFRLDASTVVSYEADFEAEAHFFSAKIKIKSEDSI